MRKRLILKLIIGRHAYVARFHSGCRDQMNRRKHTMITMMLNLQSRRRSGFIFRGKTKKQNIKTKAQGIQGTRVPSPNQDATFVCLFFASVRCFPRVCQRLSALVHPQLSVWLAKRIEKKTRKTQKQHRSFETSFIIRNE